MTDEHEEVSGRAIVSEEIRSGECRKRMVVCPGVEHQRMMTNEEAQTEMNKVIKTYYSWEHLRNRGWRFTKDPYYAEPGSKGVWVCPDCVKETGLVGEKR